MDVLEALGRALVVLIGFIGGVISQAVQSVYGLTGFYYQRSWGRIGENAPPPAANNFSRAELLFASFLALPLSIGLGWISPFVGSTVSRFGNAVVQAWRLENPEATAGRDLTLGQHAMGLLGNLGYAVGAIGVSFALIIRAGLNFCDTFIKIGAWALKKSLPAEEEAPEAAAPEAAEEPSAKSVTKILSLVGYALGAVPAAAVGAGLIFAVGAARTFNQSFWAMIASMKTLASSFWNLTPKLPEDYPGKGKSLTLPRVLGYAFGTLPGIALGLVVSTFALTARLVQTTVVSFFDTFIKVGAWALKKSLPAEEEAPKAAAPEAAEEPSEKSVAKILSLVGYALGAVPAAAVGAGLIFAVGAARTFNQSFWAMIASMKTLASSVWNLTPKLPEDYPGKGKSLTLPRVLGYAFGTLPGIALGLVVSTFALTARLVQTMVMGSIEVSEKLINKIFSEYEESAPVVAAPNHDVVDLKEESKEMEAEPAETAEPAEAAAQPAAEPAAESISRWKASRSLSFPWVLLPTNWPAYAFSLFVVGSIAALIASVSGFVTGVIKGAVWGYGHLEPNSAHIELTKTWFNSTYFPLNLLGRGVGAVIGVGSSLFVVNAKSFWNLSLNFLKVFFERAANSAKVAAAAAINPAPVPSLTARVVRGVVGAVGYIGSALLVSPFLFLAGVVVNSAFGIGRGVKYGWESATKETAQFPKLSWRESVWGAPGVLFGSIFGLTAMGIGHLGMGGLRLCQGISRGLDKTWSKVQETGTPPDQASLISGPTKVALLAEKLGRVIGGGFALGVGVFYAAALGTAHLFGSAWNAGLSSDVTAENRYERSTAWETLSKSRRAFYWASSALISLITLPLAGLLIGAQWTVRAVNQTFSAIGTMAKIGWTRELPAGKLYDGSTNKIFRTIGLVVGGSLGLFIGALGGTVSAGIDILHGIGSGIVSVVKASWKRDLSPIQNQEALPNRVASVARVFPGMVLLGALAGAFAGALSIAVDIIHGAALGLASSVEVAWKRDLSSIQNQEALPKNRVVSWAGVFPGMVLLGALAGAFAGALSIGIDIFHGIGLGFVLGFSSAFERDLSPVQNRDALSNRVVSVTRIVPGIPLGMVIGAGALFLAENFLGFFKAAGAVLSGALGLDMADSFAEDRRTKAQKAIGAIGSTLGIGFIAPVALAVRGVRLIPNVLSAGLALVFSPLVFTGKFLTKVLCGFCQPQRFAQTPRGERFRALFSGLTYSGNLKPGQLDIQASGRRSFWRSVFKVFTFNADSKTEKMLKNIARNLPEAALLERDAINARVNQVVDAEVKAQVDRINTPDCCGYLRDSSKQDAIAEVEYAGVAIKEALTREQPSIQAAVPPKAADAFSFWALCVGRRTNPAPAAEKAQVVSPEEVVV